MFHTMTDSFLTLFTFFLTLPLAASGLWIICIIYIILHYNVINESESQLMLTVLSVFYHCKNIVLFTFNNNIKKNKD